MTNQILTRSLFQSRSGNFSTGLKVIVGMKRRLKTAPASCLIFSMALPSPSIFDLREGAGKLTRAMQPSFLRLSSGGAAIGRDEFVFAFAGRFDEQRFDLLERLAELGVVRRFLAPRDNNLRPPSARHLKP